MKRFSPYALFSPRFVKFGSSRIIVLDKHKKQLFDEPALVARSTKNLEFIAFGKEANELQRFGTKEIEVLRFMERGIISDESLCTSYLTWMHGRLIQQYWDHILPIPVVYSHSVGLPDAYKRLLEQSLRSASLLPIASYPAMLADAKQALMEIQAESPILLIHMGATHIQVGIIKGMTILGSTTIPIGGDDIDRKLAESIRIQESIIVPRSYISPLKEQYTKAVSAQSPFSAVVRGRRMQSGAIESLQLREEHLETVIQSFFLEVSARIVWELEHTLSWDVSTHQDQPTVLSGALCIFPEFSQSLVPYLGDQLRIVGRASLASALGLVSLWT